MCILLYDSITSLNIKECLCFNINCEPIFIYSLVSSVDAIYGIDKKPWLISLI